MDGYPFGIIIFRYNSEFEQAAVFCLEKAFEFTSCKPKIFDETEFLQLLQYCATFKTEVNVIKEIQMDNVLYMPVKSRI